MKTALFSLVGACMVGLVATVSFVPPCRCGLESPHPVTHFRQLDPFIPLSWCVLNRTDNKHHQYVDLQLDDNVVRVFVAKREKIKSAEELVGLVRKKLIDSGYQECEEDPYGFILGTFPDVSWACIEVARSWEPVSVVVSYHTDFRKAVQALAKYFGDTGL